MTTSGRSKGGQFDFAALRGSVTSEQALSDPFNRYVTLDPNPLSLTGGFLAPPALAGAILDSHLDTRDRMGHLFAFVARLVKPAGAHGCPGGILEVDGATPPSPRGIGLNVETALLVQGHRGTQAVTAQRVTNPSNEPESAVYFVRPLAPPATCASGQPLTMTTVEIRKLADSQTVFNLSNWSGVPPYFVDAVSGKLTSSPF